jgi:hypothetical protein
MFYPVEDMTFLVSPPDVHVEGEGVIVSPEGSPVSGFALYEAPSLPLPGQVDLTLSGGAEQAVDPHAGIDMNGGSSPTEQFNVEVRPNRFSAGGTRNLAFLGLLIVLSLSLVYGLSTPVPGSTENRQLSDKALSQLRQLEDRYIDGHIDRSSFQSQRKSLLASTPASERVTAGSSAPPARAPRKA